MALILNYIATIESTRKTGILHWLYCGYRQYTEDTSNTGGLTTCLNKQKFSFGTDVLSKGIYINEPATNPEATPIYMTTAFNVEDLDDLQKRYDEHGFATIVIAIQTAAH